MKQYCRYCAYCVIGDAVYCEKHKKVMRERTACVVNKCKDFAFNEIDVFDVHHIYKPKEKKDKTFKQLKLF